MTQCSVLDSPLSVLAVFTVYVLTTGALLAAERINTLDRSGLFGYKPSGIALRGYDSVAYFTQGRPVQGSAEYALKWQGASWHFASADNRKLFEANPERYAPQFGGYCAYGVSLGSLVKIEVDVWSIVNGKLYLNYNKKLQREWEQDIPGNIAQANENFEALLLD